MVERTVPVVLVIVLLLLFSSNSIQNSIRLINGVTPNDGFIQLERENLTLAVCGQYWTEKESAVACRMLGMRGEASRWFNLQAFKSFHFKVKSFISGFQCNGSEHSLFDCGYLIKDFCFKPFDEVVGISCGFPSVEVDFSNVTKQSSVAEGSSPALALDDDPATCFHSRMERNPWIELNLRNRTFIHTLTLLLGTKDDTARKESKSIVSLCDSVTGDVIACNVTASKPRKQTVKCDPWFKTDVVRIRGLGENMSLSLCGLDVFAFDSWKDAHGVMSQRWKYFITATNESSIFKFNSLLDKPPDIYQSVLTFEYKHYPSPPGGGETVRQSGFIMVPDPGEYTIGVSECHEKCEVWFRRVQEPGMDEKGSSDDLIIKIESIVFTSYPKRMPTHNKKVQLNQCMLYYMEVYMTSYFDGELRMVYSTPNNTKPQAIPSSMLYKVRPGVRDLTFDVKNVSTRVDLGSNFDIKASYKFCCRGLICPSCPIVLKLLAFGKIVTVDERLEMNCLTYNWTYVFEVDVQPGKYSVEISYSLEGDLLGSPRRRTVFPSVEVTAPVVYRCDFLHGMCDGWQNSWELTPTWSASSTLNMLGLHERQITKPGETLLSSPQLPWKPTYKKINLCVEFSYLLPTNTTSDLEVYSQSQSSVSEKKLRWVVSGYQGSTWGRAKIPVKAGEAFKVTFKGISTVNGTIAVAVRDFRVNAEDCQLLPVFSMPGFSCKINQFQCANGQCVDRTSRCNGIIDGCLDGSDEAGCTCRASYFTCSDRTCIQYSQLCNGIRDCGNGEDENHCEIKCPGFQCFDGTCGSGSCASNQTCEEGVSSYNGNVIDAQSRSGGSPHCKSFKGLCGFENGPCGLEPNPNSSSYWRFLTPAEVLNKQENLPSHDHTTMTNKGTYFVLTSYITSAVRSTSSLHRNWTQPGPACMQFWYSVSDTTDSFLEIVFETPTSSQLLWKTSASTAKDWAFGQVQIPGNSQGKLIIQGQVREGFVALDDLGFENSQCSTILLQENPSCYFGVGEECKWIIDKGWTLTSTRLPSMSKLYDVPGVGESFLLLSSPLSRTATLSSPLTHPRGEGGWRCLRFWFYSGKKYFARTLALEFETEIRRTEAWRYSSTTDKWTFVQLPIPWQVDRLRVIIKGTIQDQGGFLAIDDVTFLKEQCRKIPVLGNECQEYEILDGTDRRSDKTIQRKKEDRPLCDDLEEQKWYRFAGAAGNQMEDFCETRDNYPVSNLIRACAYHDLRGWLNGSLPSVEEGVVEKQLCFMFGGQCCDEQTVVRVRNCGGFPVYQFPKKLASCQRYCTKYEQEKRHSNETSEWKDWVLLSSLTRWTLTADERINDVQQSILKNSGYTVIQEHGFEHDLGVRFSGLSFLPLVEFKGTLTELTLCLWALVNSSVPIYLKMEYITDRLESMEPDIVISSYRPVKWKHICVTWKSDFGLWQVYIDGILKDHGKGVWDKQILENRLYVNLRSRSAVNNEIKLTRLNIWSRVMSAHKIRYLSYQCEQDDGNSLRWSDYIQKIPQGLLKRYNSTCRRSQENVLSVISSPSPNPRNIAAIESPRYERSSDSPARCFKFRYKIWGPGATSLKIYQELDDTENTKRPIWMVKGSEDSRWKDGQVALVAVTAYKLIIEGVTSSAPGILSIEGLFTTEGYCDAVPMTARKVCDGILANQTGHITSPYYPGFYENNANCTWTIKASRGHVIRLEFKSFELEQSPQCSGDYVEVYDGEVALPVSRIGRYCGVRFHLIVQSTSDRMLVIFKSNDKTIRTGFHLVYKTITGAQDDGCIQDCPSDCYCQKTTTGNGVTLSSKKLQSVPERLPKETSAILFSRNKIHRIESKSFYNLPLLSFIDLSYNSIFKVQRQSFLDLPSLNILRLNANFIKKLDRAVFKELTSLEALDLSENLLTEIENGTFSSLSNLQILGLYSNKLRTLERMTFANNSKLLYLYLHNNLLESIPNRLFHQQKALKTLKLHSNEIKSLEKSSFKGLTALRKLTLHDNPLKEQHVDKDAFTPLISLRNLTLDSFILCCYATKTNPNLNCISHANQLSSCDDMLKTSVFRYGIWLQGIIASVGNLTVIIWWTRFAKQTKTKKNSEKQDIQSALFTNLACADFLMGIYLLFIAVHDALWMGEYFLHDVEWRSGVGCKIAGVISTLSSEVSVMVLVFVTLDRINSILFYFSAVRLTLKMTRVICSLIWMISSVLSVVPLLAPRYFNDKISGFNFYGRSTVCLPLQLSTARPAGWEYSVGIFVFFNGAAFLFILVGYLAIFYKVRQSARKMQSARSTKRPLGKRMFFIVLTDFCTWMPVVTLSALSLHGHFNDSSGQVYALIAVFVIPLNSSLNPILYTFSTVETRKKLKKAFCKWVSMFSKSDSKNINDFSRKTRETFFGLSLRRLFSRSSSSGPPNGLGIELQNITRKVSSSSKKGSTKTDST